MLLTIGAALIGLSDASPLGVSVGVPATALNEAIRVGGNALGISIPRNFKLINLHAMLNSSMFIFPSESVSAKALNSHQMQKHETKKKNVFTKIETNITKYSPNLTQNHRRQL